MNFGDVIMSSDFLRNGVLGCGETWVVACMAMDVLDRGPMLLAEGPGSMERDQWRARGGWAVDHKGCGLLSLRWTYLGTGVSDVPCRGSGKRLTSSGCPWGCILSRPHP